MIHTLKQDLQNSALFSLQKPQRCSEALCVSSASMCVPLCYSGEAFVTLDWVTLSLRYPSWACIALNPSALYSWCVVAAPSALL